MLEPPPLCSYCFLSHHRAALAGKQTAHTSCAQQLKLWVGATATAPLHNCLHSAASAANYAVSSPTKQAATRLTKAAAHTTCQTPEVPETLHPKHRKGPRSSLHHCLSGCPCPSSA
jgi:hypothetical protein